MMTRTHLIPANTLRPPDHRRKKKRESRSSWPAPNEKAKKNMMNSVVKGVSKLTLRKASSTSSASSSPVDIDDYYYEFGNDDGSHTTETASMSRSSSEHSSPLSPSRICQGPSVRHLETFPNPCPAPRRHSLVRWTEAQQEQFASRTHYSDSDDDNESGILYQDSATSTGGWDVDSFINDAEVSAQKDCHQDSQSKHSESKNYEDPPLSAQTNYAREQLLKSSRYREELKKKKSPIETAEDFIEEEDLYEFDDFCCDEVEMSRELGGYEEGFGVPSMNMNAHEYHHLPLAIREEDDEISVASSSVEELCRGETEASCSGTRNSACVHCRNGTCDNQDCSGSRFMI